MYVAILSDIRISNIKQSKYYLKTKTTTFLDISLVTVDVGW